MLALLGALFCVIANGFFVAAEFAFAKVRPTSLEAAAKSGDAAAAHAHAMLGRLDEYLAATQLGITLASLGLGRLGEPAITDLILPLLRGVGFEQAAEGIAFVVSMTTISALHIVVGELVPKSLGITRSEALVRLSARPLRFFFIAIFPALWVLNRTSNLVLRALRLPAPEHAEGKLSLEELQLLIVASLPGDEAAQQRAILERVLRATDRPVRAVMVPRVDMHILSLKDDADSALAKMRKHGYSRYPISRDDNPDHVVGYLYFKDVLLMQSTKEQGSIARLKRDILIVPESRTVGEVLEEFQRTKIPIALVVDEYGGTSGLVTMEDVVAELVGDLRDELQGANQPKIVRDGAGFVVDGALHLDDVELDGTRLSSDEDVDTVGGWVVAELGRLAGPGDAVEFEGWTAIVEDVRQRRVSRVRFVRSEGRPQSLRPTS